MGDPNGRYIIPYGRPYDRVENHQFVVKGWNVCGDENGRRVLNRKQFTDGALDILLKW
jgi:hypothetical protein